MKGTMIKTLVFLLVVCLQFVLIPREEVYAATTPSMGTAATFVILSNTYTNTVGGTTLNGDLGYTTGPASTPTVNGTTYSPPSSTYTQAGTDQGSALSSLNSQPCTHTFPAGAVDLATDTSHGSIGVYNPGVYCTTTSSAASIGTGGITLSGSGTYIFRIDGALTTDANSVVSVSNGASACDVFWTPAAATTLGANTTFIGTDIDDSGITIGSTVNWTGRALAYASTVSTTTDTLTAPTCTTPTATPTPTTAAGATSTTSSSGTGSVAGVSAKNCPPLTAETPIIIDSKRIDADSVFLSWGPYSGLDTFVVQYGLENGNFQYSMFVTGFSTEINDLPLNQPIWVRIAGTDNCSIGTYGSAKLVGGPGLPNTGNSPHRTSLLWSVLTASLALAFGILRIKRI